MSSEYDEIGKNSYFQRSQQILNDLQRQHQHQPMLHFNYGQHVFQWRIIVKPLHNNLPQIIPKCFTNIMILIHGHLHNVQHKSLQAMNLRLVNDLHQFSLLRPRKMQPHKKQYKGEGRVSVR